MAKLKEEYKSRIFGELEQKLGVKNKMLVPRLQKVVVNMAFGIVSKDEQKGLVEDLHRHRLQGRAEGPRRGPAGDHRPEASPLQG